MKLPLAPCLLLSVAAYAPFAAGQPYRPDEAGRIQALTSSLRQQWAARAALGRSPTAIVEPSVSAGKILTPTVNVGLAPGVPELQITVKSGTVGLNSFIVSMTSPSGLRSVSTGFVSPPGYPAEPRTETIKFQVTSPFTNDGFGLYTQPGGWTLSGLTLFAKDGQIVNYNGTEIAALFPSLTVNVVNDGTPDVTAPAILNGSILTPTVSLSAASPIFAARLGVKDDVSGVASVSLGISGPAGSSINTNAYVATSAPVLKGSVIPYLQIQATYPAGTYTITSVGACDVAQNCTYVTASADIASILGTTTFDVTD